MIRKKKVGQRNSFHCEHIIKYANQKFEADTSDTSQRLCEPLCLCIKVSQRYLREVLCWKQLLPSGVKGSTRFFNKKEDIEGCLAQEKS